MNCFGVRTRTAVVLGTVVAALSVFLPISQAGRQPIDTQSTILQLERDVPELMKEGRVPGLAIAREDHRTNSLEPSDRISELAQRRFTPYLLHAGRAL
jgi:hypothetical protein